jgi:hypothetical protein
MKMCEYANNLTDMSFLVWAMDKNSDIFYEVISSYSSLLNVSADSSLSAVVFPGKNIGFDYIIIEKLGRAIKFDKVSFEEAFKIDPVLVIYYHLIR